jgi:hypothetical protein
LIHLPLTPHALRHANLLRRCRHRRIRMSIWFSALAIELLIILTVVFSTGVK